MLPSWRKHKSWLKYIKEPGVTGRWIADHTTERKDDDVVLLFVHGGCFVMDTGGTCQFFWLNLMKEMYLKRGIKFSIFQLDYEMAPDFRFPSQIIEINTAYAYLVNKLGINASKICISGDSAGGQMILATLLHLARPSEAIKIPPSFGLVPPTPGVGLRALITFECH
jgi:acetyl esterase/lipase